MPSLSTRKEARERLLQLAQAAINRLVPADERVPLRGSTFVDFENQTYEAGDDLLAAMMEERCKLERNALVESAGACPHCGSNRTYLEEKGKSRKEEIRSPSGSVVIQKQGARCRACDGSFSPSSQGLAAAVGSRADAARGTACGPRERHAAL